MPRERESGCPVVIGGVGGSGTRVVAQILADLGFYMGTHLNPAMDNLWFTFLFKRPNVLLRDAKVDSREIPFALRIMDMLMTGVPLSREERFELFRISMSSPFSFGPKLSRSCAHAIKIRTKCLMNMLTVSGVHHADAAGWGWKEPTSHLFLRPLADFYPGMRYIHVIRNGIDMAFSSNLGQLRLWGRIFDVAMPRRRVDLPSAALSYWVKANKAAAALCEELFPGRSLLVNFDRLCKAPADGVEEIIEFLGVAAGKATLAKLSGIPVAPPSTGRYMGRDLTGLLESDIDAVRQFGFSVEAGAGKTE